MSNDFENAIGSECLPGHPFNGKCVLSRALRVTLSAASSMTGNGRQRSVLREDTRCGLENGMPASLMTLFCKGAVITSLRIRPIAASHPLPVTQDHSSRLLALAGFGYHPLRQLLRVKRDWQDLQFAGRFVTARSLRESGPISEIVTSMPSERARDLSCSGSATRTKSGRSSLDASDRQRSGPIPAGSPAVSSNGVESGTAQSHTAVCARIQMRLTTKASSRSRRIHNCVSSSILLLRIRASQFMRFRSSVLS